jgi:hypothetical protein
MKRSDVNNRLYEILYEIYKHKAMTIGQIQALYFESFFRARNYLLNLEKKGLIKRMFAILDITKGRPEQIFLLTLEGIEILRNKGYKTGTGDKIHKYLIKAGEAQIRHDLKLVDIIIYLYSNNLIEEYTTELFLRQMRYAEKGTYRIPDIVFKDKEGYGFIELEERSRSGRKLLNDFNDYIIYNKDFKKIFVVRDERLEFYYKILTRSVLTNWEIGTFNNKVLVKKYKS